MHRLVHLHRAYQTPVFLPEFGFAFNGGYRNFTPIPLGIRGIIVPYGSHQRAVFLSDFNLSFIGCDDHQRLIAVDVGRNGIAIPDGSYQ